MAATPVAAAAMPVDLQLPKAADARGNYSAWEVRPLHDPSVSFDEYLYYAKISRAEEDRLYGKRSDSATTRRALQASILGKLGRRVSPTREKGDARLSPSQAGKGGGSVLDTSAVPDAEWSQASRAARTASWAAIFYLITTDILGPYTAPWAFSQLGYGPGVSLYSIFGILAWYSGYQIWKMFIALDSDRYPLKGYGDIAFRVFGTWARHTVNILQSFQFFLNVALLIIGSGMSISQMTKQSLCFIICVLIAMLAGWLIGQIRTLSRLGWVANLAVWLNVAVLIITMVSVTNHPPNYIAVAASSPQLLPSGPEHPGPIYHTAGVPADLTFTDNITGLMQAVFSYGGATLFTELMAEMRRPMDFWKALLCADVLIYVIYVFFGGYVYGQQGQYAYQNAPQGISPYGPQTACNALAVVSGLIAACLYGNIGVKVLYHNVGRDFLRAPLLESKKGKLLWVVLVPAYWGAAFVIALAVPQITNLGAFVAALCILQFTYTFPPLLMIGFKAQRDAILPEESFDPNTGQVLHMDSGVKRWIRGLKKEWYWNSWDFFYFLGAVVTAGLGLYSSVTEMIDAYQNAPNLSGFSCKSPTG